MTCDYQYDKDSYKKTKFDQYLIPNIDNWMNNPMSIISVK